MAIAEIRVIVSSKKLYEALAALDGLCLQSPMVIIADGLVHQSKPKPKSGMTAPQAVDTLLATKKNGDVVSATDLREHIRSKGIASTATYYGISKSIEDGKLKKLGNAKYRVVKQ